MNKYLEKIATVIEPGENGNMRIYPEGHKYARRADKAKLINPKVEKPKMNKYLKGALITGTVAKTALTGAALYALHKKHQKNVESRKAKLEEHVKAAAKGFQNAQGEPGSSINATPQSTELLQTGVSLGAGAATTHAFERLAPRIASRFGRAGKLTALLGGTAIADYATVRANNAINARAQHQNNADQL